MKENTIESGKSVKQELLDIVESPENNLVFICDNTAGFGVLRLRKGEWAMKTFLVHLEFCSNPLCGCTMITLRCVPADIPNPTPSDALSVCLDPLERTATTLPEQALEGTRYEPKLAKAIVKEFRIEEWSVLTHYLYVMKNEIIRNMDVTKIDLAETMPSFHDDGGMESFNAAFPLASYFPFECKGIHWMVSDLHCVQPGCKCKEAALTFLVISPPDIGATINKKKNQPTLFFNFKRNSYKVEQEPPAGYPTPVELLNKVREDYPAFAEEIKKRHHQLRALYARVLEHKEGIQRGKTVSENAPRIGRNDPCPCGSGKKYKKCCANK